MSTPRRHLNVEMSPDVTHAASNAAATMARISLRRFCPVMPRKGRTVCSSIVLPSMAIAIENVHSGSTVTSPSSSTSQTARPEAATPSGCVSRRT